MAGPLVEIGSANAILHGRKPTGYIFGVRVSKTTTFLKNFKNH
jgi:hypothetical protein